MSTRVYLGSTVALLARHLGEGGVGPAPFRAHAVTPELETAWPEASEEEWEYVALVAAAEDSLALLTHDDVPRRVVLVLDVETVLPGEDSGSATSVEVPDVVPFRLAAAVHVDDAEAAGAVADARAALAQGADATAVLERCLDHELGWYATQEVGALLDELDELDE